MPQVSTCGPGAGRLQRPFGHDEVPIWTLIQQPTCGNHSHKTPALWGTWVPLFEESPFTTSERSTIWVGWGQHLGDCQMSRMSGQGTVRRLGSHLCCLVDVPMTLRSSFTFRASVSHYSRASRDLQSLRPPPEFRPCPQPGAASFCTSATGAVTSWILLSYLWGCTLHPAGPRQRGSGSFGWQIKFSSGGENN